MRPKHTKLLARVSRFTAKRGAASSNRFIKIRYEWSRVTQVVLVGSGLIAAFYCYDYLRAAELLPANLYLSIILKLGFAMSFPLILFPLRFYEERELRRAADLVKKATLIVRPDSLEKAAELNR